MNAGRMNAVIANVFRPSENSLLHARNQSGRPVSHWSPWLLLVWSIWIFLTPITQAPGFTQWLWPTVVGFAFFLWLFHRVYYRDRRHILACALATVALGMITTPVNPGAQGYLVYACGFLAWAMTPRRSVAAMAGLLALYSVEWMWLGFPGVYLFNVVLVSLCVGLMNLSFARKLQADAALKLSHDEVRRLAALAERERIGRDLHDLLGHTLSLVALKSELASKLVGRDIHAARSELEDVSRIARDALAQVRHAVTGIRAAGIAAELASARLLLESDAVHFRYTLGEVTLPPELETAFALTLREAITNIQRHARAHMATVELMRDGNDAVLGISDDGRGGDIAPGNGLTGMRERIEALGGRLRVDSAAGRGTRIEARLPLPSRIGAPPVAVPAPSLAPLLVERAGLAGSAGSAA